MSDAACELAYRLHFLGLKKLRFQLLPCGDILDHVDGVWRDLSQPGRERDIQASPDDSSIFSNVTFLYLIMFFFARNKFFVKIQILGGILRVSEFIQNFAVKFFHPVAQHFLKGLITLSPLSLHRAPRRYDHHGRSSDIRIETVGHYYGSCKIPLKHAFCHQDTSASPKA